GVQTCALPIYPKAQGGSRRSSGFISSETLNPEKQETSRQALVVSVTFHIPGPLRPFTGGRSAVEIEASPATLRDALEALWALYPGIRDRVAAENGHIREPANLFVAAEAARLTRGLATPLPDAAEISIVPAISGG